MATPSTKAAVTAGAVPGAVPAGGPLAGGAASGRVTWKRQHQSSLDMLRCYGYNREALTVSETKVDCCNQEGCPFGRLRL